jgi:hypothetical protein
MRTRHFLVISLLLVSVGAAKLLIAYPEAAAQQAPSVAGAQDAQGPQGARTRWRR